MKKVQKKEWEDKGFKVVSLWEVGAMSHDEMFLPPDIMQAGHDDIREVWDYAIDLSWIMVNGGAEIAADRNTLVLVRQ